MTDKEQIIEMHEIMKQAYETKCKGRFCNGCEFAGKDGIYCGYYLEANALYDAGYHKMVWHKVADGDLPNDKKEVLIYTSDGAYYIAFYNPVYNAFYPDHINRELKTAVIAWTELPKYKE